MTIKDYKLIQADGNRALQEEVGRFVKEGWAPKGRPFIIEVGETYTSILQAIILREPESQELLRLRHWHREATEAVDAWEHGQVDADSSLGHIRAVLRNHLVKG